MKLKYVIIGGLIAAGIKALKYFNLARNLEFVPKVRVHQVSKSGIKLAVDLQIINPTKVKVSFTKPYVGVYLNDNLVGYQEAGPEKTEIRAQGTTSFTVLINVPYSLSLLSILQSKPTVRVKILTYVDNKQVEVIQNLNLAGIAFHTYQTQKPQSGAYA